MKKFTCPTCGTDAWAPDALMEVAQMDPKIAFYCAYGHASHFKLSRKQAEEEAAKQPLLKIEDKSQITDAENVVQFPKRG